MERFIQRSETGTNFERRKRLGVKKCISDTVEKNS